MLSELRCEEYYDARYEGRFFCKNLVMTHLQGPNSITLEFSSSAFWTLFLACGTNPKRRIWKTFIPFPFLQVFHRGAYYSKEVIPDQVAVVSLNTMYFYDSNKGNIMWWRYLLLICVLWPICVLILAVGGCGFKDPDDPGNLQFDWLEVQLKTYRWRKMQVCWFTSMEGTFLICFWSKVWLTGQSRPSYVCRWNWTWQILL